MSKVSGFLFPWRKTFRRLELEKRWWHRLAVVLFFVALLPAFLWTWVIGDDAFHPANIYQTDIHHWATLEGAPNGMMFDLDSMKQLDTSAPPTTPPPTVQKTIEMPDGTTATYPGTASDESIKDDWRRKLDTATAKAGWLGFAIAVPCTLIFSYLLQVIYRALLYVIFGAKAKAVPDPQ